MNVADELLAQEPLLSVVENVAAMASEQERRAYLMHPNNGIILSLAKLKLMPTGPNACSSLIDRICDAGAGRMKGSLNSAIDNRIKELNKERIQEKLGGTLKIDDLHTKINGELVTNFHNMLLLAGTDLWNVFNFDTFSGETFFSRPAPWCGDEERTRFAVRAKSDNDTTSCVAWMNTKGLDPRWSDVNKVIDKVADDNRIDRYIEWMDAMPQWDGTPRLDTWLFDHCGAEPNFITSLYGRKFVISMVARCYIPGCLAKNVLILEGTQNLAKSKIPEVMGGPFYIELGGAKNLDLTKADSQVVLQGASVVEIPENVLSKRADTDAIKAYFSQKNSKVRRAYGHHFEYLPRRNVFIITLNTDIIKEYLTDPTGNIRYYPVQCGVGKSSLWEANIELFEISWPQILAEAITYQKQGEKWWLNKEQEQLQIAHVSSREVKSDAQYYIELYIGSNPQWSEYGIRSERIKGWCVKNKYPNLHPRNIAQGLKEMGFETSAFTLTSEEKERLGPLKTRQVNLWYPAGARDKIEQARTTGNIPLEFAYVPNDYDAGSF